MVEGSKALYLFEIVPVPGLVTKTAGTATSSGSMRQVEKSFSEERSIFALAYTLNCAANFVHAFCFCSRLPYPLAAHRHAWPLCCAKGQRLADTLGVPGHVQRHDEGGGAGAAASPAEARDALLRLQPTGEDAVPPCMLLGASFYFVPSRRMHEEAARLGMVASYTPDFS